MDEYDPGSFRDPEGRVFEHKGRIFRRLSPGAERRMARLEDDGTLGALTKAGLLIESRLMSTAEAEVEELRADERVMEHRRIPVVTYPYEWPFSLLRDAALLTLDMIEACLARGLMLKDATAYNVMILEGRPVFIDTLSIDDYRPSQPWDGYGQFCRGFLFPLMLQAYKALPFQPFLRTDPMGPTADDVARIMSLRDRLRPGVFKHVALQAYFDRLFGNQDIRRKGKTSTLKIDKRIIEANIKGLRRLIRKLNYQGPKTIWVEYERTHSYSDAETNQKKDFCIDVVRRAGARRVIDLGCNTGAFSAAVATGCDNLTEIVSVDLDPAVIDVLYRRQQQNGTGKIVPVVADLLNPSPAIGWALEERRSFFNRLGSDAFLALALVHHVCISGNVPLPDFIRVLARIAPAGVLEWVAKIDPMVQTLLRNREDIFPHYTWESFRDAVANEFEIVDVVESHGGNRRLCHLGPLPDRA